MLKIFAALVRNEIRSFFRNRIAAFWSLVFPLFLFSVLFLLHGSDRLGVVAIEVRLAASSPQSEALLDAVRSAADRETLVRMKVSQTASDAPVGRDAVRLEIPENFGAPGAMPIVVETVGARVPASEAAARIIAGAVMQFELKRGGLSMPVAFEHAGETSQKPALGRGQYLLGGVLVMMMMSTGLMSTASVLAAMREHNIFRVYGCLPIPRLYFLLSIVAVRLLLIVAFAALLLLVGRYVFGISVDLWGMRAPFVLLLVVTGGVVFLALGLMVGARVSTIATATIIANLIYFPLLMLGDLTFPLIDLPGWAQKFLSEMPVNQLVSATRAALFETVAPFDVLRLCIIYLGVGLCMIALAARFFRWSR